MSALHIQPEPHALAFGGAPRGLKPRGSGAVAPRVVGPCIWVHSTVRCLEGVGGDFLNTSKPRRGLMCLTLADVTGHDRESARFADRFHKVLAGMDDVHRNERRWLSQLNRRLCRCFDEDHFGAALSLAIHSYVDDDGLVASIANAGMPRPLLYSAASGRVERVGRVAPPLGVFDEDAHLPVPHRVNLAPGDLLVLMSDGVTDLLGDGVGLPLDRCLGIVQTLAAAGGRTLHNSMVSIVERRMPEAPHRDDFTLAVVEVLCGENARVTAAA